MSHSTTSFLRSWDTNPPIDSNPATSQPKPTPVPAQAPWLQPGKITPAWEVDALCWPDVVLRLEQHFADTMNRVSQHLVASHRAGLKVLAITSAERGVGRSTVAMYIARAAAFGSLRVALVDADLLSPSLADQLQLDAPNAWTQCISEHIPIAEVAIQSVQESVTVFPLLEPTPLQFLEQHAQDTADLIRRLSEEYDLVVLDSCMFSQPTAKLAGIGNPSAIQAAIVVADAELSSHERTQAACTALNAIGLSSVGIVENFRP